MVVRTHYLRQQRQLLHVVNAVAGFFRRYVPFSDEILKGLILYLVPTKTTLGEQCLEAFFWQWLRDTRASHPPVPLRSLSFRAGSILRYEIRKGMVSYSAPNKSPNVYASVWYRVTRASGSNPVVQGGTSPYLSHGLFVSYLHGGEVIQADYPNRLSPRHVLVKRIA